MKIYCAGPLFNQAERNEMCEIADRLLAAGFDVYLPHRDGMEFRLVHDVLTQRGWEPTVAGQFLHEAIFALDVYQLAVECQAMAWNMNGRVPDEGAVSEAAIAWTLGKPLVAYRDDVRSLIAGRVNPLLAGLVDFSWVETLDDLAARVQEEIARQPPPVFSLNDLPARLRQAVADGAVLWKQLRTEQAACDNDLLADCVAELFAPSPPQLRVG